MPDDRRRPRHHVEHVMGMAVSIDVRDPVDLEVITDVVGWLHQVDATYSTYRMDSPVSRFGLGQLTRDELDPEVRQVLQLCDELRVDTDGVFDAWSVPAPNGSRFDPSGVVKGWAIERAALRLERHGARSFCVNAGGDIVVRGEPEPGRPWTIGIRHPADRLATAAVIQPGPGAVATSATYERGAHIVDPATGEPTARLASVTVVGPDLALADALATTVFVMGVEGLTWLQGRHPRYAGMVVTHEERVVMSTGFAVLRPELVSVR